MTKASATKYSCFAAVFLLFAFLFTGCAGKAQEDSNSAEPPEFPALFDDWQHKGFGGEYPLWCEAVILQKSMDELASFFPEIKDHREDVVILLSYGMDIDMSTHLAMEEDSLESASKPDSKLIAKSWVKINPVYHEYEFPYIYIRIYLKNFQEE